MGVFLFMYIFIIVEANKLKSSILNIYEEILNEKQTELQLEGLSDAYGKLAKFLLKQVQLGKFLKNYDIDTSSGRMMFKTQSGKTIVFNDMKLGVTLNKTWKGKKKSDFFSYKDHKKILKFALADI